MHLLPKCRLLYRFGGRAASHCVSKLKTLKWQLVSFMLLGMALLMMQSSITAAPLVKNPLAPPDTSSPQATIKSFVENVDESHRILMAAYSQYLKEPGQFPSTSVREQTEHAEFLFKRAERCLDLSEIPERLRRHEATEATLLLKEIFDRIEIPPYAEIAGAKAIADDKELSRWILPHTEIDIVKVEEGSRAGEFLFSPMTVANLGEFYHKVQQLPYKPHATVGFHQFYISTPGRLFPYKWLQGFPSWLNSMYWEQTLWQWIGLGIFLLMAFWIPYSSLQLCLRNVAALNPLQQTWAILLPLIIAIVSLATVGYSIDWLLNITGRPYIILSTTLGIIFWMVLSLTVFFLGNVIAETIIISPKINSDGLDASLLRTVFRLLSITVGIAILIFGIARVGISLVPVLASLGIGGLALALAAQPTLENIIAGLILFTDRPVSVGDFCRFGDQAGTVEKIGLRSTRIRGIDRTVTSVPNADFSKKELVNYSQRDRRLLKTIIGLRYETNSEQLRYVLIKLREMLLAHPKLIEEAARVRFVKYGDYSQDVEIFVYVDTSNTPEFLGIQEDILLRIKDIVEAAGTDFAFPSQTAYISRDSGLDQEKSRAAESQVQVWRSQGKLPFPEFPPERREQLRDTLDYPPEGSPDAHPNFGQGNNSSSVNQSEKL